MKILLGVTGSVAAIKTQEIIDNIYSEAEKCNVAISGLVVVVSRAASMFVKMDELKGADFCFSDDAEYRPENLWKQKGDPVLHVDLRKWADILVIAPLTAHTMAKLANGLCDTLLTCIVRAWDFDKPMILFPAMNTFMWNHPLTDVHVNVLTRVLKAVVIQPLEEKTLACGDVGPGALPHPSEIAKLVISQINH